MVLALANEWEQAVEFFWSLVKRGRPAPDTACCDATLLACRRSGRWSEALDVLDYARREDVAVEPTSGMYMLAMMTMLWVSTRGGGGGKERVCLLFMVCCVLVLIWYCGLPFLSLCSEAAFFWGGQGELEGAGVVFGIYAWPYDHRVYTLAFLQCQDGACRIFTDQADIACSRREAP